MSEEEKQKRIQVLNEKAKADTISVQERTELFMLRYGWSKEIAKQHAQQSRNRYYA
jgi:hypothetical protein